MGKIYSYHIFFLPFIWEKKSFELNQILSFSSENCIWEDAKKFESNSYMSKTNVIEMDSMEYNTFHYFNENVRDLIIPGVENEMVCSYQLQKKYLDELKYIIIKEKNRYELPIENILVHVFNTEVAVFELKCKNERYNNLKAVKEINEYGRRLGLPFWPEQGYSKCADFLQIIGMNLNVSDDFKSFKNQEVSFCYLSKIVRELLNRNGKNIVFRAKKTEQKNEVQIRTVLDEKMYVCCLIEDEFFVKQLCRSYHQNNGCFTEEESINIYELIRVDVDGSYYNKNLLREKELLYNSIYIDEFAGNFPKIAAVTDQCYIKILTKMDYDRKYFKGIYSKIILLTLVQRMSIAKFSTVINRWIRELKNFNKHIPRRKICEIMILQQQFSAFQNQYLINEITVKNEGRYLYQHARECLVIDDAYEGLSRQVNSLYELVSTAQGDFISKWGFALTLIGGVFAEIGMILTANDIAMLDIKNYHGGIIFLIVSVTALLIIGIVFGLFYKRRK